MIFIDHGEGTRDPPINIDLDRLCTTEKEGIGPKCQGPLFPIFILNYDNDKLRWQRYKIYNWLLSQNDW